MKFAGLLAVAFLVTGCTAPNPRSCVDGLCTDQRYPFCDVDGPFEGTPQTCIAVTCSPGEHAGCRGDTSLVCNTTGNDYDLVECPRGCDTPTGCRECDDNAQCSGTRPICDGAGNCRAWNPDSGAYERKP